MRSNPVKDFQERTPSTQKSVVPPSEYTESLAPRDFMAAAMLPMIARSQGWAIFEMYQIQETILASVIPLEVFP